MEQSSKEVYTLSKPSDPCLKYGYVSPHTTTDTFHCFVDQVLSDFGFDRSDLYKQLYFKDIIEICQSGSFLLGVKSMVSTLMHLSKHDLFQKERLDKW